MILKIPYSVDDFIVKTRVKKDIEMVGNISFSTSLRLDGKLTGDIISSEGLLIISETGVVDGNISAGTIMIAGKVYGNISATRKVELFSGSEVIGNIKAPKFRMEDDVKFEGECDIFYEEVEKEVQMHKPTSIFIILLLILVPFTVSLAQKEKQTYRKTNKIVVKGPNVKIEKDYTLFQSSATQRPIANQGSNYIEADTIKYFSSKNYTISEGNVIFKNLEKNIEIASGYSEFYGNSGDVIFTKSPRMYLSNNNMYVGGERVYLNVNEDKVNVETNTFITNEKCKIIC